MNNSFVKILCSLPLILIFLYFLPFVGICLILLRAFVFPHKSKIATPIILVGVGIAVYIPKLLKFIFEKVNISMDTIPYLKDILGSDFYNVDMIKYSKYLITAGVILLIISYALKNLIQKLESKFNQGMQNYISESVKQDAEISKKNDMEIKLKQEKAKNTGYVKCPNCGSNNLVSEKVTTCKYCRQPIENKNYK